MTDPASGSGDAAPEEETVADDEFDSDEFESDEFGDEFDDDVFAGDPSLAEYEQRLAAQRVSSINAGKRKAGLAGAAMAGAMFALAEIIEGPPKEDSPVTVEASSKPHDLEKEGFAETIGGVDVEAPPLERIDPVTNRKSAPRR
jgi:hypothetical protein